MSLTPLAGWSDGALIAFGVSLHDGTPTTTACLTEPHLHLIAQRAACYGVADGFAFPIEARNQLGVVTMPELDGMMLCLDNVAVLLGLVRVSDDELQRADAWIDANGGQEI